MYVKPKQSELEFGSQLKIKIPRTFFDPSILSSKVKEGERERGMKQTTD